MSISVLDAGRSLDGNCPARPALSRCIGVDAETFATQHWGRAPLLSRRDQLPAPFDDLLDLDGIDELLSERGLRTPFLRIARDGAVVDSRQFTGPGGAGAEIADQVRDDRVLRLFAEGHTVVLQGLHRLWPPLIDFVRRLGTELGHPCQANAYVTPAGARGFAAHYDVHDVFVLQLAGRKQWTVHAPVHPDPLRNQPWEQRAAAVADAARDQPALIDTQLTPGDALYLPRGYLHAAAAQDEVCAHLTIGIHPVTRYALVEAFCARLADEPALRASLPMGIDTADPDQLQPHLQEVAAVLHDALDRLRASELAGIVRRSVWSGSRPEPVRPLAAAEFASRLQAGDLIRLRHGLRHRLRTRQGDDLTLELPDRSITLPAVTGPALRTVLLGAPVPAGALPGLDLADQLVLLRRLLHEGVVVPAGPADG